MESKKFNKRNGLTSKFAGIYHIYVNFISCARGFILEIARVLALKISIRRTIELSEMLQLLLVTQRASCALVRVGLIIAAFVLCVSGYCTTWDGSEPACPQPGAFRPFFN